MAFSSQALSEYFYNFHEASSSNIPDKKQSLKLLKELLHVFFPQFGGSVCKQQIMKSSLIHIESELTQILYQTYNDMDKSTRIAESFFQSLPSVHKKLLADAESMFAGDPAAQSTDEVIVTYPGFLAVSIFRIAHELFVLDVPILPRLFTEYAHRVTGIDIHPGANIGNSFCIDHGTGIVIGETTHIGDNVKLYQGVTLGALSVKKELASKKRHPTIENGAVIYANATILGGETIIGENAIIGGNVWITKSVPKNGRVYYDNSASIHKSERV